MDILFLLKSEKPELQIRREAAAQITDQRNEIKQLREALQQLLDVQNGPPLGGRYAEEWHAAVDKAHNVLKRSFHFKCPLNDPDCKENCGNYGCGN